MISYLESLFKSNVTGAKSTALHPLHWVMAMLVGCIAIMATAGGPSWCLIVVFSMLGAVLIVYLYSFIFLLKKDPDTLR